MFSLLVFCNSLYLKCILSDMSIATLAFFGFSFVWDTFSHVLSVYVSKDLKWVSCRQQIYEPCICIHAASLCFLVEIFILFAYKVIINVWSFAVLLIVLNLFCGWFFFPFPFIFFCDLITNFTVIFGCLFLCVDIL